MVRQQHQDEYKLWQNGFHILPEVCQQWYPYIDAPMLLAGTYIKVHTKAREEHPGAQWALASYRDPDTNLWMGRIYKDREQAEKDLYKSGWEGGEINKEVSIIELPAVQWTVCKHPQPKTEACRTRADTDRKVSQTQHQQIPNQRCQYYHSLDAAIETAKK